MQVDEEGNRIASHFRILLITRHFLHLEKASGFKLITVNHRELQRGPAGWISVLLDTDDDDDDDEPPSVWGQIRVGGKRQRERQGSESLEPHL